jgi:hypothetical protein
MPLNGEKPLQGEKCFRRICVCEFRDEVHAALGVAGGANLLFEVNTEVPTGRRGAAVVAGCGVEGNETDSFNAGADSGAAAL